MSPSEIELAAEIGFKILKLFPAAQLDGVAFLKALYSTYTLLDVKFIPLGGVSVANMQHYLALPNVIAVGGTWLTAGDIIATKQFEKITERVEEALSKTK
jgi:2-dehydro-3-deoxyphosphogluconate aldolase/(4S)-4-hydroxy-2-oxoglutarate aldolase